MACESRKKSAVRAHACVQPSLPVIADGLEHGLTVRAREPIQASQVQTHVLGDHVIRA